MEISRIKPKWCKGCDDTYHNANDISSIRACKLCNYCKKQKDLDKEIDERRKKVEDREKEKKERLKLEDN